MAITWAEARDKVRGDLWRTASGVPDDVVNRALHSSILEIETERRWLWLENIRTSTAVEEETDRVAAPVDLRSVQSLCYRRSGSTSLDPPLTIATLAAVRMRSSTVGGAGAPSIYAYSGDELHFDCKLPVGSGLDLVYTSRTKDDLAVVVAAGDTNITLQVQQQAVIANAAHFVALTYLKNTEEAERQRAAYRLALERIFNIEDEARADLSGGLIVPDIYYREAAWGTEQWL